MDLNLLFLFCSTENLHEVKLEDGSIAYIALNVPMLSPVEMETAPSNEDAVDLGYVYLSFDQCLKVISVYILSGCAIRHINLLSCK